MVTRVKSPPAPIMLVSIRPHYVRQILEGTKTIELRRTRPLVRQGQTVAIYATLPKGAIVATARIESVSGAPKGEFWLDHGERLGVSRCEYDEYFHDQESVVGIHLSHVRELTHPLSLVQMRAKGLSNPPQQWAYLDHGTWGDTLELLGQVPPIGLGWHHEGGRR